MTLPQPPYDEVIRFRNAALEDYYKSVVNYITLYGQNIIDRQDAAGCTVLMYAAIRNNVKIMTYLLENGANTEIKSNQGHTALTFTGRDHCVETAAILEQWDKKQKQQEELRERSAKTENRINILKKKRAASPFIHK